MSVTGSPSVDDAVGGDCKDPVSAVELVRLESEVSSKLGSGWPTDWHKSRAIPANNTINPGQ
jgi:hypothetical protein